MKLLLNILGVLAVLMGVMWIGQGAGLIRFVDSFMVDNRIWEVWGVLLATVGVGMLVLARRR